MYGPWHNPLLKRFSVLGTKTEIFQRVDYPPVRSFSHSHQGQPCDQLFMGPCETNSLWVSRFTVPDLRRGDLVSRDLSRTRFRDLHPQSMFLFSTYKTLYPTSRKIKVFILLIPHLWCTGPDLIHPRSPSI